MNIAAYGQPDIVGDFASRRALTPAEVAALGEVWPKVRGHVLDIGAGGGRTTEYLLGAAGSYTALDISPAMVDACRRRFPGAVVEVGDARTLTGHPDAAFDLVLFSFNGIDYVDHGERSQVLAAVHRVLRPGGAFVYSSHNLAVLHGELPGVAMPALAWTANPARLAVRSLRCWQSRRRRRRNRARLDDRQHFAEGYAVVNDEAYDHALLTVYVDPAHERSALEAAGFSGVATIDARGRRDPERLDDPWVYYIAYKAAK